MWEKKKRNMDYKHYENIINYLFYVSLVILKLIEIVSFKAWRVSRCRINCKIRTEFTESVSDFHIHQVCERWGY